ncbi:MAG: metallopeptidase family protein [Deinococcales bacterium]
MTFLEFQQRLQEMIEIIPERFMKNLQGIHCFPEIKHSPEQRGLVRMGEYLDPGFESFMAAGVHIGRHINIYYGSFVAVARYNPDFDWEEQLWETLTHELQHHLESQANDQSLIEWDKQQLEKFRAQQRTLPQWQDFS